MIVFTSKFGQYIRVLLVLFLLGGNVLCLEIWKGHKNGDPYLHSIHFAFALGAFLSPILAEPFLSKTSVKAETDEHAINLNTTKPDNLTILSQDVYGIPGMYILYPTIGFLTILSSIGYLIFAIKGRRKKTSQTIAHENMNDNQSSNTNVSYTTQDEDTKKKEMIYKRLLVITLLMFLFTYVGTEIMFGTYIATFAVDSELQLSRQEAAFVNAVFWGSFAAMRFASVFIAFRISSLYQLLSSFILCGIGIITLAIAAESSIDVLYVCCAVMGTGCASIWACGILWLKQHIEFTNKIGSLMVVAGSIGGNSFNIIMGQFIADLPMLLMYVEVVLVFLCITIFTFGYLITKRLKAEGISDELKQVEARRPSIYERRPSIL